MKEWKYKIANGQIGDIVAVAAGSRGSVARFTPVCGHEGPYGGSGRVAAPQNPGSVLETMEKGANEV